MPIPQILLDCLMCYSSIGIQMRRNRSKLRQRLRRLEQARSAYVQQILDERGPVRRGSFVTLRRKCGKPNCHCATGEGHPASYLSLKEQGRTRMIYLPADLAARIAQEAERYRRLRHARAMLAKLAGEALAVIDELQQALEATGGLPGKKGKGKKRSRRRGLPQKRG